MWDNCSGMGGIGWCRCARMMHHVLWKKSLIINWHAWRELLRLLGPEGEQDIAFSRLNLRKYAGSA